MASRSLGSLNRLPELQDGLRKIWYAQYTQTLDIAHVKNEVAIRDTLAKLEQDVFGGTREQINDAYTRMLQLRNKVLGF